MVSKKPPVGRVMLPVIVSAGMVTVPVNVGDARGASKVPLLDMHVAQVPVRLVITPLAGVPRAGVTSVGEVSVPVMLVSAKAGALLSVGASPAAPEPCETRT